jgi:hypothetical protein
MKWRNEPTPATQQSLSGTQLDWFRMYGQTQPMKDAGISAPFSTKSGGFANPFLTTAGKPAASGGLDWGGQSLYLGAVSGLDFP